MDKKSYGTKSYNTKNRRVILDYLKENHAVMVSVQDILGFLKENGIIVNRSTVYRYLNQLCADGFIMKYVDNVEGKTVFQYVEGQHACSGHIHLKCVKCNSIIHLECEFMEEIQEHLKKEHQFNLQCEGSVLYGICNHCKNKMQIDGKVHS